MSSTAEDAASSLRASQKPLKDKYKNDPQSAFVTLSTSGTLDPVNLTCSLSSGAAAKRVAGLHQAAGGKTPDVSQELCSGDMLLESLVACFGVTLRAVGTALAIPIKSGTLTAHGDLDFRGTLGIKDTSNPDTAIPVGFQSIRLTIRLDVDEPHRDKIPKLISLSERYCVVLQTLRQGVTVETQLGHVGSVVPDARKDSGVEVDGKEQGEEEGMEGRMDDQDVLRVN